jgi:hypothetical protein
VYVVDMSPGPVPERQEDYDRLTVDIVCDAESHAPRVAWIAGFVMPRRGAYFGHHAYGSEYGGSGWTVQPKGRSALQHLAGGSDSTGDGPPLVPLDDAPAGRARMALKCPLCGLDVPLRGSTLVELLNRLTRYNDGVVFRVSLQTLPQLVARMRTYKR